MQKGFFEVLFDFSFKSFVTPKIIKLLFILGIFGAAVTTFSALVGGFQVGIVQGIIVLLLSPVIFILSVLWTRIFLELIIVIFNISENISCVCKPKPAPAPAPAPKAEEKPAAAPVAPAKAEVKTEAKPEVKATPEDKKTDDKSK